MKGPGFWKLSCSLKKKNDKEYVNELNLFLPTWIQEGKQDLGDLRSIWDWVKYKVKKYSRWYSMNKCKQENLEEQQLNRQFQEATVANQNCPSQENLSALSILKEKMEHLYEKKVEGIIMRSRAGWHEHGERNSKYFLNLERRNHVRKHIRKLRMSGVISTNSFEILEAEHAFYENLYKSKRDGSEVNNPYFHFEDLTNTNTFK